LSGATAGVVGNYKIFNDIHYAPFPVVVRVGTKYISDTCAVVRYNTILSDFDK